MHESSRAARGSARTDEDRPRGTARLARPVHEPARQNWDTIGTYDASGSIQRVRTVVDGSVGEVFVDRGPCFTERVCSPAPHTLRLLDAGADSRCRVVFRSLCGQ